MGTTTWRCRNCGGSNSGRGGCSVCGERSLQVLPGGLLSSLSGTAALGDMEALGVLERWVPDQPEPEPEPRAQPQSFALRALLWTCTLAVWVGIIIVSLVALFFLVVVLTAFLR